MNKRLLAVLLCLVLLVGLMPFGAFAVSSTDTAVTAAETTTAASSAAADLTYLAFTSDVHNGSDSTAANRLTTWLTNVTNKVGGEIDFMGFCGDNGSATAGESDFWKWTENVLDNAKNHEKVADSLSTTGNHEFYNGNYSSTSNPVKDRLVRVGLVKNAANYIIYCFGPAFWQGTSDDEFTTADINTLNTDLGKLTAADQKKPIFILSHFPIHSYQSRSTKNADQLVKVLNGYADKGYEIYFLWGHNHTLSDTHYDEIFTGKIDSTAISFTYLAAGCMSDSEYYGSGSRSVKGKGLLVGIDGDDVVSMTYYDANANDVTEQGGVAPTVAPTSAPSGTTPESGKQYLIVSSDGYALTTAAGESYSNGGSGSSGSYNYTGLAGTAYSSGMTVTSDMVWTFTSSGSGFVISNGGKYLNGTYTSNDNNGYDGALNLNSTQDVWTLSGGLLKSTNATSQAPTSSQSSKDKYLTHGNGDNGDVNTFSVRSESTATTLTFIEVKNGQIVEPSTPPSTEPSTQPGTGSVYELTTSLTAGQDYLIVNVNSGPGYALVNNNGKLSTVAVTVSGNKITLNNSGAVWSAVANGSSLQLKNGSNLLDCTRTNDALDGVLQTNTSLDSNRSWSYADSQLLYTTGNNSYNVYYSSGFSAVHSKADSSHTSDKVYIFARTNESTDPTPDPACTHPENMVLLSGKILASCTEDGYTGDMKCLNCGKIITPGEVIPAKGHQFTVENAKDPTCTEKGYSGDQVCSVCGEKVLGNEIEPLGHKWGNGEVTRKATCTEDGERTFTCLNDSKHTKTETIPALGHVAGEPTGAFPATCTKEGYTGDVHCVICGELIEAGKAIPKLAHKLISHPEVPATEDAAGTEAYWECSECGKLFSDEAGKNEIAAPVVIPKLDHTHKLEKIPGTPATCTADGVADYWRCSKCGEMFSDDAGTIALDAPVVIKALGHSWGEGVVTKAATCTEPGVLTFTCSRCGETKAEAIEALGHDWDDGVVTKAATCTEEGVLTFTCKHDATHTKTEVIDKIAHDTELKDAKEATCTEKGYTGDLVCKVCGEVVQKGTEIDKIAHTLVKHEAKEPTATEPGNIEYWECSACHKLFSDAEGKTEIKLEDTVIPATGEKKCDGGANCPSIVLTDVDRSAKSWYHEAVDWAFVKGIVTGTTPTTFSPKADCTREQMVTFLWRMNGSPDPKSMVSPFTDVKDPGHYAYKAILWAAEQSITNGTSPTTFSPKNNVTREQVVTLLWRMKGSPIVEGAMQFTDVTTKDYSYNAVMWAVQEGITNGRKNDMFEPKGNCTRSEIVTFLWRYAGEPAAV